MMPSFVAADSGMDALTHATEAFVSVYANDFTDGMALQAIKLIFANIEKSVIDDDRDARETMHNAATIAGMAFGNAFLGVVHAMSHTCGSTFKQIHGRTNAVFLAEAIRYNGQIPTKLNSWPKYETYTAPERFQRIARELGLPASTPEEGVESYATACENLRRGWGCRARSRRWASTRPTSWARSTSWQCGPSRTSARPANPRIATLEHMKEMMEACYYGVRRDDILARRAAGAEPEAPAPEEAAAPAPEEAAPTAARPQGEEPEGKRRRSSAKRDRPRADGVGGGW